MRITRISVHRVELPFADGCYGWAKGKSIAIADSTVVRLDTDAGLTGWGETCPLGGVYLPAYPEGVRTGVGMLAPYLIGLDPTRIGAVGAAMDGALQGHPYVKSAIDVACWDILGKAAGLPVHALLGGRRNDAMPMYRAIPQGPPEAMVELADKYRAQGYGQIQLKVGGDPIDDAARIRAVVESGPPGEVLLADANRGWRRDEAVQVAKATRDLDYVMEQPCDRYADCLSVRRRTDQRFKLDESLQSLEDTLRALQDDAMDVACIKISKQGGLTKARLIRDLCAESGIPMTVEDAWGGEIVTAALAHLAASTPPEALLNTTDLQSYNTVHIADGAPEVVEGRLTVGERPGLGVTPLEDVLGAPVAVYGED